MPRPRVSSTFNSSPVAAPRSTGLRVPAIVATGRKFFTVTEQITHGSSEGTDTLAHTATAIIRVGNFTSTTDYALTTDYLLSGGNISWSPGGAEPTVGQKYFITYTYAKVAADFAPKRFDGDLNAIITEYGPVAFTAGVLNAESYITMMAQIEMAAGASTLIISQVNNAAATPVASEFSTAIDALENTKALGLAPYYLTPGIGALSDADVPTVNTKCLAHANKMADPQFQLERRVYTGLKSNSSATAVQTAAQAFAASRLTLAANFDPQISVSGIDGLVTLGGDMAAAAVAGFRSSQPAAEPALNKAIPSFTGFKTLFDPVTIDLLVDAGALVLESEGGVIRVVDDNTTNQADEVESSIPTVEHRDVMIQRIRRNVRAKFQGKRGGPTITSEMEESVGFDLQDEITKGDVQKASRPHAVRQTGSLNRFAISFSYLPAGKVRDVDINFSVDLSLA